MKTLVFLEHHEGRLAKDSLGVLSKAASLGGEVEAVLLGADVEGLAGDAGRFGAARVHVQDDVMLGAPLPQPRVDALETLVRRRRGRTGRPPRRGPELGPHRPGR
jgi:electron transfer flavoprotein alpha subunit